MTNRRIFFLLALVLIGMIAVTSLSIAYAGGIRGIGLLGVCFFLTGGILVVLAQVIPAGIVLSSLVGATFSSSRRGELPIRAT